MHLWDFLRCAYYVIPKHLEILTSVHLQIHTNTYPILMKFIQFEILCRSVDASQKEPPDESLNSSLSPLGSHMMKYWKPEGTAAIVMRLETDDAPGASNESTLE